MNIRESAPLPSVIWETSNETGGLAIMQIGGKFTVMLGNDQAYCQREMTAAELDELALALNTRAARAPAI